MNYFERKRIKKVNSIISYITMSQAESVTLNEKNKIKKKKEKKIILACSSVISVFLVVVIIIASFANHFLNRINYGDVEGSVSDTLDAEEELDFDGAEIVALTEEHTTQATTKQNDEKKDKVTTTTPNNEDSVIKILNKTDDYKNLNTGAEIQAKANEEIKKNIENDDGIWKSSDVYNLLIVGYDAGDAEKVMFEGATLPRSDAIILVSLNYVKNTVKMISLSRATYVAIPGHGNKRINTAHAYGGATMLVDTIELNYKIKIDRYVTADFDGFKSIIDALDGVTIDLTQIEAAFALDDETKQAGKYTLDGHQALRYVRLRKTDSDRQRTGRQRKVLKAISNKAKNMTFSQEIEVMNEVLPYVTTNFTKTELLSKVNNLQKYLSWTMTQDIIPHNATKLTMRDGKEVIILDWNDVTKYIHSILYSGVKVKKV